jgi:hypothetical protein
VEGSEVVMENCRSLDLRKLGNKISALTAELERCYAHAAGVCLEKVKHDQGVRMNVTGGWSQKFELYWPPA